MSAEFEAGLKHLLPMIGNQARFVFSITNLILSVVCGIFSTPIMKSLMISICSTLFYFMPLWVHLQSKRLKTMRLRHNPQYLEVCAELNNIT